MPPGDLSGKQRRHLRALGQRLAASVQVGHDGMTDTLVAQVAAQLDAHELVKVRVGENAPEDRHDTAEALARRTDAHLAQVLGRTALLYKARKESPAIVLPS